MHSWACDGSNSSVPHDRLPGAHQVGEIETKGAVYNLNAFGGKLLAGINARVQLYRWAARDGGRGLVSECCDHGNILALYVVVRGDFIIVGDLMKSIRCALSGHVFAGLHAPLSYQHAYSSK